MGPGGLLEVSWRPLGAFEEAWSAKGRLPEAYGALLDASWKPLGALLEALGAEKKFWDRLLDGPKAPRRSVSACLAAKYLPKRSPGESQIEVQKRSELKIVSSSKTIVFIMFFFDF